MCVLVLLGREASRRRRLSTHTPPPLITTNTTTHTQQRRQGRAGGGRAHAAAASRAVRVALCFVFEGGDPRRAGPTLRAALQNPHLPTPTDGSPPPPKNPRHRPRFCGIRRPPRTFLLHGPPGTGKVRARALCAGAPCVRRPAILTAHHAHHNFAGRSEAERRGSARERPRVRGERDLRPPGQHQPTRRDDTNDLGESEGERGGTTGESVP